ncbi:MAG: hypothetical protein Ct9H300mP8_04250 [Gammaproteobacteria bacterium]|nr:MAG: hypothetical protein Ct9H300mP8_04250 [Gammaproteobacteria bacterium]
MKTMFYRFDPECRGRDILMLEGKNRRDLLLYEVQKKYGAAVCDDFSDDGLEVFSTVFASSIKAMGLFPANTCVGNGDAVVHPIRVSRV